MPLGGIGTGLLVESHMGRPTKVEGNPDHPASLGATDAFAQASILGLYDPDRSQVVSSAGEIRPWSAFVTALRRRPRSERESGGAGVRILTETVTSPTLAAQLRASARGLSERALGPVGSARPRRRDDRGADGAFGAAADAQYRFAAADVVLALDADFLASGPGHVRYAP